MWVARYCAIAVLLSPALPVVSAAAEMAVPEADRPEEKTASGEPLFELISTAPHNVADAMAPDEGDHEAADSLEPQDTPSALSQFRAITTPDTIEELTESEPEREAIAALNLPEAEVLSASTKPPVLLKPTTLKDKALVSKAVLVPLKETAEREPLLASLKIEPAGQVDMAMTEISGQELVDPLTVIVSLKDQQMDVYRGDERIETTRISSGKKGYQTLTGVFGILQKKPEHYSNLYDSAPMPWMQRLTRSGTAIHAGAVPNYPASHGCVRMPHKFAPKLFRMTELGGKVAMLTGAMVTPKRIESPVLVEPASSSEDWDLQADKFVEAGLRAGARAAALPVNAKLAETKEPAKDAKNKNDAPWHILVARREERDIAIGTQEALAAMGYLEPQDKFVGYLGNGTRNAIRAFEKDHGLRQRGVFNEAIAAKIYKAAGKGALPDAYLYLRKGFSRVRNVPVQIKDIKKPLGTHLFTYVRPSDGSEPGWVGMSLEGQDSKAVLNRITVPDDMQRQIAAGLTSGASFIVADVAKHSSVLPEGDDFIVRTTDSAKSNAVAEKEKARQRALAARKPAAQPKKRIIRAAPKRKTVQRRVSAPRGFRLFGRSR